MNNKNGFGAKLRKILLALIIFFFASTILAVVIYRFVPVFVTPLMVIRTVEQTFDPDSKVVWHHHWVPLKKISKNLPRAVVAAEDNNFMTHHGFDFGAIQQAIEDHEDGKRLRGGSTISQQTAKNVFLWPTSSWVRKGFEAYFTVLIEIVWGKERIMEVYLNSIEMGNGIYGAEAVARDNFDKHASSLTRSESALVAATLINPRRYSSLHPSGRMLRRQQHILSLMYKIGPVNFD